MNKKNSMKSINILYIGDPNSIHDFKWITYFSKFSDYTTYLIAEKNTYQGLSEVKKQELLDHNVKLLDPINDFSISSPIKTFKAIKQLRRLIKQNNIDTVHALFGSPQPIWLNFISKSAKKIITTRGSDVLILIKGLKEQPSLLNKILHFLIKRGFKISNQITSTSQKQIDYIQKEIVNKEVSLIKTGVNVEEIEQHSTPTQIELPKNKKVILSIRYIADIYNIDYQIEAIKLLEEGYLKESLFIFIKSDNCEESILSDFTQKLDSIPSFSYKIINSLNQHEIWSLIKASNLIYMVPKSDGTPNSALETMAAGKPLIMGNLDYNKELFENVCLVADLANPRSLTELIIQSTNHYPEDLIRNGKNKVKEFGSRKFEMNKLKKIYDSKERPQS